MNLTERLNEIRHEFETGDTPQEIVDVLNSHIDDLIASNATEKALPVGSTLPSDLTVWSGGPGEPAIPLEKLIGEHYLVLTWFRGNW